MLRDDRGAELLQGLGGLQLFGQIGAPLQNGIFVQTLKRKLSQRPRDRLWNAFQFRLQQKFHSTGESGMHDIALIGAGRIGKIHAANIAAHPALRLAWVIDPHASSAEALATQHGARVGTLDAALADASVAGVVIASSTDTHLDYSLAAARAGKAVFCEKPLDQDLGRATQAAAEFEKLGARLFLAFNRRFDPNFASLQARLSGGAVGALETLHIISPRSRAAPRPTMSPARAACSRTW
jgi:predicted dehydrogenase